MPAGSFADVLGRARELLAVAPAGLFTDVDGTISPIVARPELATVSPTIRRALRRLARRLALVGAVSARAARDARRLVGLPELVYVGNHGSETLADGVLRRAAPAEGAAATISGVLAESRRLLPLPGLRLEDKGGTAAIHYRECPDQPAARLAILDALRQIPAAGDLVVEEGRLVVNLLPAAAPNKGSAVVALSEAHGLIAVLYLGDDRTDMHAFEALRTWRQQPGRRALAIAVLSPEAPVGLAELADVSLDGVPAVEALLSALVADDRAAND